MLTLVLCTVISLHTALKELEDEIENPDSIFNRTGAGKRKELGILVQNCKGVLQQLNKLLTKYKSLGTGSKRAWDRLRWGTENLAEIREKIMSHTSSLTLFLTTLGTGSLGRIEKKLDQLIQDVRAGRREETVFTMAKDDEDEAERQWDLWKRELVDDDGFTKVELEGHKHWIKARLIELIEAGGLHEEHFPENESASDSVVPDTSKDEISVNGNISQNLKKADNSGPSTKLPNLQPTVEDVEDDIEDNEIRDDETVVLQQASKQSEPIVPASEEVAQKNQKAKAEQKFASGDFEEFEKPYESEGPEESDDTDSTNSPLPSDSISNIGVNAGHESPVANRRSPEDLRSPPMLRAETFATKGARSPQKAFTPSYEEAPRRSSDHQRDSETPPTQAHGVPKESKEKRSFKYRGNIVEHPSPPPILKAPKLNTQYSAPPIIPSSILPNSRKKPPLSKDEYPRNEDRVPILPVRPVKAFEVDDRGRAPEEIRFRNDVKYDTESSDSDFSDFSVFPPPPRPSSSRRTPRRMVQEPTRYFIDGPGGRSVPVYRHGGKYFPAERDPRNDSYVETRESYVYPRDRQHGSEHQGAYFGDVKYDYSPGPGPSRAFPYPSTNGGASPTSLNASRPAANPPGGFAFDFSNPESIFSEFLQSHKDRGGAGGFENHFSKLESPAPTPQATPEVTTVERPLPLTLEELFKGTHKKMKVTSMIFDVVTGKRVKKDKVLEMDIKPGLKKGSRIKFKGVGDEEEGGRQNLHFIVEEVSASIRNSLLQSMILIILQKPHPVFTRDGADIYQTIEISLLESLCGWERTIPTIDGSTVHIKRDGPIPPGARHFFAERGMPISKTPDKRGFFIIRFEVKYPISITTEQIRQLRKILG
jgi:DnaJ family protein B protein 4